MWRTIRMWWLLGQLEKDCIFSEGKELHHDHTIRTMVLENRFLERMARQKVHPFHPYGVCSKCKKDHRQEVDAKFGKKVAFWQAKYAVLLDVCKERGYIEEKHEDGEKDGVEFCRNWIRLKKHAHEITGFFDLFEMLLKQYKLTWTFILIPLLPWLINLAVTAFSG